MSFDGCEIYFTRAPDLAGKTFGEAELCFENDTLIGLQTSDGRTLLNPRSELIIQPNDELIVIAEDASTIAINTNASGGHPTDLVNASAIQAQEPAPNKPERTLILGWNKRVPIMLQELDAYVAPNSATTVVSEFEGVQAQVEHIAESLKNQSVRMIAGATTNRRTLDRLKIDTYDHVIVVSGVDNLDEEQADAHTLITLLHLRALDGSGTRHFSIVSEMLDAHNRELAEVAHPDDFIVSTQLVSFFMSQLAESPRLYPILMDLFSPEGNEIYLKPMNEYILPGHAVNFLTVAEAARRHGEVAIGYRLRAEATDAAKNYGVRVNPDKAEPVTFSDNDRIIVIAEN